MADLNHLTTVYGALHYDGLNETSRINLLSQEDW